MAGKKRELDITDRNILEELQKNARASFTDIGACVGLTGPAVRDRIRQMEDNGIISGYRVAIDHALLGNPIRAMITLQSKHEPGKRRVPDGFIVETLDNMPEVLRYWSVTGDVDFIIEIALSTMKGVDELHRKLDRLGIFTTYMVLNCSGESCVVPKSAD